MELFYSGNTDGKTVVLEDDEAMHCVKVLRHRAGDMIHVIDGKGTLYSCRLASCSPKTAEAEIVETIQNWNSRPYTLEMAVCLTKNMDRYEWFAEKACETGTDTIVPVIGDHSERKTVKTDRLRKILLSAAKQSLKAEIPEVKEPLTVREYVGNMKDSGSLKLMAYCFEDEDTPRISIEEALRGMPARCRSVSVLIGPEGDFSREEAETAVRNGFIPVHLGQSRLRTETAALAAVFAVYFHFGSLADNLDSGVKAYLDD